MYVPCMVFFLLIVYLYIARGVTEKIQKKVKKNEQNFLLVVVDNMYVYTTISFVFAYNFFINTDNFNGTIECLEKATMRENEVVEQVSMYVCILYGVFFTNCLFIYCKGGVYILCLIFNLDVHYD